MQGSPFVTSAQLRAAFSSAAAAVLCIEADFLSHQEVEQLKAAILACLGDPHYVARRTAIPAATAMLRVHEDTQVLSTQATFFNLASAINYCLGNLIW